MSPHAEAVARYLRASLSENTRRAYRSDIAHFEAWGGSIPAVPEMIAAYLAAHARVLKAATLDRRLASISKAHEAAAYPNPTRRELVKATRRGIRRVEGTVQRRVAPLLKQELGRVVGAMGESPKDIRDRALLLIGFAGAFRRSELVALDRKDIEFTPPGLAITIRRSKTDQFGARRRIGIALARNGHCAVVALERWLSYAGIEDGPIFRRIDHHGNIFVTRLAPEAVALIVKEGVAASGLDPESYSGHSLRAGYVTSAALDGAPTWRIRQQTGHSSDTLLTRYIRPSRV